MPIPLQLLNQVDAASSSLFLTDEESGPQKGEGTGAGHKGSKPVELGFKSQSSLTSPSTSLPTVHPIHQQISTTLLFKIPPISPLPPTCLPALVLAALQWHPGKSICSCPAPTRQSEVRTCHFSTQSLELAPPPHQSLCPTGPQASPDLARD